MKKLELTKNEQDNLWSVVFSSNTMKQDIVLTIDLDQLCIELLTNFTEPLLNKGTELDITSISLSLKLVFIILRKKINQLTSITTNNIISSENLTFQKNKNPIKKPKRVIPVTFKPISKISTKQLSAQRKEFGFNTTTQDSDLGKLSVFNSQNTLEVQLNSEDFEVARASYQEELLGVDEVPRDDFDDFNNFNNNEQFNDNNNDYNENINDQNNSTTNNMLSLNTTSKHKSNNKSSLNKLNTNDKETLISSKKIKRQLKNTRNIIKELKYSENDYIIKEKDFLVPFSNMIKQSMDIIKSFNVNKELNNNDINNNLLDDSGITLGNFENLDLEENIEDNDFNENHDNNDFNYNNGEEMTADYYYGKEYNVKTTFNKETTGMNKLEAGKEFMNVLESIGGSKIEVTQKESYGDIVIKPINN